MVERKRNNWAPYILVCAWYGVVLCFLLDQRPLWLDEILQLLGTRDTRTASGVIAWARLNPGGAPLGYLTQWFFLRQLGFSIITARLPAALFAIGACAGIAAIARRLRISGIVAVLLFAILPLPLRYALEGRPYTEALFFSVWCTLLLISFWQEGSPLVATGYCVAAALAMYTQPYSVFPQAGACAILLCRSNDPKARRRAAVLGGLLLLAGVLFLPWYLSSRAAWSGALRADGHGLVLEPKLLLQILKEFSGGGYLVSVAVLLAAVIGFLSLGGVRDTGALVLAAASAVAAIAPLAADRAGGYFFAARQEIFALPSLALLAGAGITALAAKHKPMAVGLMLLLCAGSVWKDFSYLKERREDWRMTAVILRRATDSGYCLVVLPVGSPPDLYGFFEPSLLEHTCPDPASAAEVVTVASPYVTAAEKEAARREMLGRGLLEVASFQVGNSWLSLLRAPAPETTATP